MKALKFYITVVYLLQRFKVRHHSHKNHFPRKMMNGYPNRVCLVDDLFRQIFVKFGLNFTPFSSTFVVNFEQVNAEWE